VGEKVGTQPGKRKKGKRNRETARGGTIGESEKRPTPGRHALGCSEKGERRGEEATEKKKS